MAPRVNNYLGRTRYNLLGKMDIEGTQGMLALDKHCQRQMIARYSGQQKLQVFTKLGKQATTKQVNYEISITK